LAVLAGLGWSRHTCIPEGFMQAIIMITSFLQVFPSFKVI